MAVVAREMSTDGKMRMKPVGAANEIQPSVVESDGWAARHHSKPWHRGWTAVSHQSQRMGSAERGITVELISNEGREAHRSGERA